ncbi:UDP-glucose 4-epimerase [Betaproteobacteria bacterium]|nr:UDP-glucose 4-epimerase [Betaproteobacteria bacterium]GHU47647.1 UDP-glucose 4-epimerase [Betaproteobacteria bacterium]
MNILLTGGTGYIGSHTAVTLIEAGHRVALLDNLANSSADVPERIAQITGMKPAFIKADVRDTATLTQTLRDFSIDAVVHFAGLKAVGESVEKPIDYYANNVEGTIRLLEAMRETTCKTLVFSSSATVYGEPQYLPLDEGHPLSVTNPYGRCKLHCEEILRDVVVAYPDWNIACLRYFNPVGAHDSGLIGEHPAGIPNNLMPYIARVAAGALPQVQVFGNDYPTPDGSGVRDYIHVSDLAEGHAAALNWLTTHPGWHAINLGTGQGYSVLEMVAAFAKASGKTVPYRIAPRRAGDVAACYANPTKAAQELGWQAGRSLEDMCASAWKFQQNFQAGRVF